MLFAPDELESESFHRSAVFGYALLTCIIPGICKVILKLKKTFPTKHVLDVSFPR